MEILDTLLPVLVSRGGRSIADIIPDIVVEESHRDGLAITQHPVEKGAMVSDHAVKLPAEVEMRCGWSDSNGGFGYSREAYNALLALQKEREPFDVSTGKRLYSNMLVKGVSVSTDSKSENGLLASVILQEVRIVSTQTAGGSTGSRGNQAMPERTGAVLDTGSKSLSNVPTLS